MLGLGLVAHHVHQLIAVPQRQADLLARGFRQVQHDRIQRFHQRMRAQEMEGQVEHALAQPVAARLRVLLQVALCAQRVRVTLRGALVQAAARHDLHQAQVARGTLETVQHLERLAHRAHVQRICRHRFT
ncbi:hypothetical protein D3C72_1668710 [compost metagenome]